LTEGGLIISKGGKGFGTQIRKLVSDKMDIREIDCAFRRCGEVMKLKKVII
jgi:hypothetical protein